jgi:uncharacterized protein with von Willebrand factor type A (vWA) domain
MRGMENMGQELLRGIGEEKLKAIAESEDGKRLSKIVDMKEAEKAVKSGDMEQMKALLTKVLSSEEGRRLAEQLSKLGN